MKKRTLIFSLLLVGILSVALSVGITMAKYFSTLEGETPFDLTIGTHNKYTYAVFDESTGALSIRNRKAVVVYDENNNPIELIDKDGTYELGTNGVVYELPTKDDASIAILENAAVPTDARTDGWDADRNTDNAFELQITSVSFDDNIKLQGNLKALFYHFEALQTVDFQNADFGAVTNLMECFDGCKSLTAVLFDENINTSKVTSMAKMFTGCGKLQTADISNFDFDSVTTMEQMFDACGSLFDDFSFVNGLNAPELTSISNMFSDCTSMTSINFNGIDTPKLESVSGIFIRCTSLTSVTFGAVSTPKLTDMTMMFFSCTALPSIDMSMFDTENVTSMNSTFYNCSGLTSLTLGDNFKTSSATNMNRMFSGCGNLTKLDIGYFDTSNVTNMCEMFNGCSKLTDLDVSHFVTSNVTNMSKMFGYVKVENLDISNFDVSSVTNMHAMFDYCSNIKVWDLSNFKPNANADMSYMFRGNEKLETIYVSDQFVITDEMNLTAMFMGCSSLTGGNGTTLSSTGGSTDGTYARIDTADTPGYFTLKTEN